MMHVPNRTNQKIAVEVENQESGTDLVFVCHGLSGSREQPHIQALREVFQEHDFTVVSFDARNSFGESDGNLIDVTATGYIEDLEDVIEWSKSQEWFKAPFFITGHSLGGLSLLSYALNNPEMVAGLVPVSAAASGKVWLDSQDQDYLDEWKQRGYIEKVSTSLPGNSGRVGYSFAENFVTYELIETVKSITAPTLFVVGDQDTGTPPSLQQQLADSISGPTEVKLIQNMGHNPRTDAEIAELKATVGAWLEEIGR